MNKITFVARLFLGFLFFTVGLNGFFHFLPEPSIPASFATFINGLESSGYFMPFLRLCETISGALLLADLLVPLALVVLAPIIINIFLVHVVLAPDNLLFAVVIGVIELYLAFFSENYSHPIRKLFQIEKRSKAAASPRRA